MYFRPSLDYCIPAFRAFIFTSIDVCRVLETSRINLRIHCTQFDLVLSLSFCFLRSSVNRECKDVVCFSADNFNFLAQKLQLDLHEPPTQQVSALNIIFFIIRQVPQFQGWIGTSIGKRLMHGYFPLSPHSPPPSQTASTASVASNFS